ncbi:MAG: transglutaminase-like domain-containing protein [Candidatus Marinimicrobia bacterium]|nr:transglutaminase-like domain-containing protein [Candidatus Neomarinimicrobiota bacterium]
MSPIWTIESRVKPFLTFIRINVFIVIITFTSCSYQNIRPNPAEIDLMQTALQGLSADYSNPRLVNGKLVVIVSEIDTILGRSPNTNNSTGDISADQTPFLGIWSADIDSYPTQKLLTDKTITPAPDMTFTDNQYGNRVLFWDVLKQLDQNNTLSIFREFSYLTFDYRPQTDPEAERQAWHTIPNQILAKYTRAEPFLEQDEALIDTVFHLLENISDPVSQANVLYDWVQSSMTYIYPPEERGVQNAFATLQGDCGQYSALFITMARIAGIPARQQSGFNFYPGNTGAHVWSEIYLPIKGWVPVDATREDGFLHLDNRRLITSVGLNIPLELAPDWATFTNSEVENGRTDFMQMFTLVSRGVLANYRTERIVIRSVEL